MGATLKHLRCPYSVSYVVENRRKVSRISTYTVSPRIVCNFRVFVMVIEGQSCGNQRPEGDGQAANQRSGPVNVSLTQPEYRVEPTEAFPPMHMPVSVVRLECSVAAFQTGIISLIRCRSTSKLMSVLREYPLSNKSTLLD